MAVGAADGAASREDGPITPRSRASGPRGPLGQAATAWRAASRAPPSTPRRPARNRRLRRHRPSRSPWPRNPRRNRRGRRGKCPPAWRRRASGPGRAADGGLSRAWRRAGGWSAGRNHLGLVADQVLRGEQGRELAHARSRSSDIEQPRRVARARGRSAISSARQREVERLDRQRSIGGRIAVDHERPAAAPLGDASDAMSVKVSRIPGNALDSPGPTAKWPMTGK